MRADGQIARIGVQKYRQPDGTIRLEYRPREEVMRADSLATFERVPVTNDHPPEKVTARNAKRYGVGVVEAGVREDGEHVVASLLFLDAETVEQIDAGKVELSCGYECDLDKTPGVYNGERYDAIQRNIRGNHVALVKNGRAGSARLRLDAAEQILDDDDLSPRKDSPIMDFEKLYKEAVAEKAAAIARADAADKALAAANTRADKAEAQRDAEKTRADNADKLRADAQTAAPGVMRERLALEAQAIGFLRTDADDKTDFKLDADTDRKIHERVLERIGVKLDAGKSDDYVRARYDAEVARYGGADADAAAVRRATETTRKDAGTSPAAGARDRMINANRDAWRPAPAGK